LWIMIKTQRIRWIIHFFPKYDFVNFFILDHFGISLKVSTLFGWGLAIVQGMFRPWSSMQTNNCFTIQSSYGFVHPTINKRFPRVSLNTRC
jgi:hypothetical protein